MSKECENCKRLNAKVQTLEVEIRDLKRRNNLLADEAKKNIRSTVKEVIADMEADGEVLRKPIKIVPAMRKEKA